MYKQSQIEELSLAIAQYLVPEAYQKDTPPKVRAEDIAAHLINKGYVKLNDLSKNKAGIKEVVEWVEANRISSAELRVVIVITEGEWQAKLKEWGIK